MDHDYLVSYVLRRPNWPSRNGIHCSAQLLGLARRRLVRLRYNRANSQILVYPLESPTGAMLIGDEILLATLFPHSKPRVQLAPHRNARQNLLCRIALRDALKEGGYLREEDRAAYNTRRFLWSIELITFVIACVVAQGVSSELSERLVLQGVMWLIIAAAVPTIRHWRRWRLTVEGERQRDSRTVNWAQIGAKAKHNPDEELMLGREDFDLGLIESSGSLDDKDREAIRKILQTAFSVPRIAGLRQ